MITIGITGSIGMGKTTAADMLRALGIPVHDSDASVHAMLAPGGRAVPAVARHFPEALKKDDGGEPYIDRAVLGRLVFGDRARKKLLESLIHPLVWEESEHFRRLHEQRAAEMIALDMPLLFETCGEERVDVTICVSAPETVQRERVLARPGMTSEKFDRIVSGQLPDVEKRKRADFVVDTGVDVEDTRRQLQQIIKKLKSIKDYA